MLFYISSPYRWASLQTLSSLRGPPTLNSQPKKKEGNDVSLILNLTCCSALKLLQGTFDKVEPGM